MKLMYDGAAYSGWQIQPHARSVQEELQRGFKRLLGKEIEIVGSGRTDSGVHALGQTAHFDYQGTMQPKQLIYALKRHLPHDLMVFEICPVRDDFHARYDACERFYRYLLAKSQTPFNRLYMGYCKGYRIDKERIYAALPHYLGSYDYSSFAKPNPNIPNRICNVKTLSMEEQSDHFCFEIRADRFLHNMVRRIIGSLLSISQHRLKPDTPLQWLLNPNPIQTMLFPAPAEGLYLVEVGYPEDKFCNTIDAISVISATTADNGSG